MKYIILLFLLTACGKTPKEPCYHNCNKIKPPAQKPAPVDTTSQPEQSSDTPPSTTPKDSPSDPTSISIKGTTTDEKRYCTVTVPKHADSLSHFQVNVQIIQKHGNITVQSLVNVKVTKDINKPNIYYSSKSKPSINLEFQSGSIVYFSLWENAQKKYSCNFK